MSLSPTAQSQVQACGSSILQMMVLQKGKDLTLDFASTVFSNQSEEQTEYQCLVCAKTQAKMGACGNCHAVPYCNTTCQRKDWKSRHRYECNAMKQAYEGLRKAGRI